jgi:KDO2-lipid IV(A) lauroyltransferase
VTGLTERLRDLVRYDSALWRRAFAAGVKHGPDPWVRYSPALFGVGFGLGLHAQRAVVRDTLRLILGPRPAWQEARDVAAVFVTFAGSMTDAMLLGADRGYVPQSQAIGAWHFEQAHALGRGLIMATANTAGWDLGGRILSGVQPADVLVVMEPEGDAAALAIQDSLRARAGTQVVHVGPDPLASLPLLHHLRRRRGVVAMKFDRIHPTMRARPVRFFGQSWRVAEGPLLLAAVTGAPIVPVFTRRLGFMRYECIMMPHIALPPRPDAAALDEAAQKLAGSLERFARAYPTQWFRFKAD